MDAPSNKDGRNLSLRVLTAQADAETETIVTNKNPYSLSTFCKLTPCLAHVGMVFFSPFIYLRQELGRSEAGARQERGRCRRYPCFEAGKLRHRESNSLIPIYYLAENSSNPRRA